MHTTTRDYPPGALRASDADRDRAVAELSEAFQAGRITADEFDERSAQALRARTGEELTALLQDLPADRAPAARAAEVDQAHRALAARIVTGASAAAATAEVSGAISGAVAATRAIAVARAGRGVLFGTALRG